MRADTRGVGFEESLNSLGKAGGEGTDLGGADFPEGPDFLPFNGVGFPKGRIKGGEKHQKVQKTFKGEGRGRSEISRGEKLNDSASRPC